MSEAVAAPRRVLVTGASGAIGTPVCRHLQARGHHVRGFALAAHPDLTDSHVGDLTDREAVRAAVAGMDTVVHLGAYPNDADFLDVLLEPNVRGLHHVCDAAVEAGVERLVLASSLQVISGLREGDIAADGLIRVADGVAPTNHYALTKVWLEEAGRMVARVHGLSVILVRIGWFPRNTGEAKRLAGYERGPSVYLSHPDAARFFERCVESGRPAAGEAATLFAISRPAGPARLDLAPARDVIGYEPQDSWPAGLPFPHE